jgi:uncharacterized YigZ family protein
VKPSLAGPTRHEMEVKRSRFLCQATAVENAEAALAFLRAVSVADATHNCWAYRIGDDYRSSDDGEPSGTAGRPILAAIDGQGLDAVVAVVTRWYGGVKLGAGGLVRAYGGCAAECLRLAVRVQRVRMIEARLRCGFDDLGTAHALLAQHLAEKRGERFDAEGAELSLEVPQNGFETLQAAVREASRGRIDLRALDRAGE